MNLIVPFTLQCQVRTLRMLRCGLCRYIIDVNGGDSIGADILIFYQQNNVFSRQRGSVHRYEIQTDYFI